MIAKLIVIKFWITYGGKTYKKPRKLRGGLPVRWFRLQLCGNKKADKYNLITAIFNYNKRVTNI